MGTDLNHQSPVAIVGMGGVFPDAADPEQLWNNIIKVKDSACEPPKGRWSLSVDDVYDPAPAADKVYSKKACFIDDFKCERDGLEIDESFLASLDPMFQLLLYAGRQAWQDTVTSSLNKERTGTIIGNIVLPTASASAYAAEILGPAFDIFTPPLSSSTVQNATHPANRYVAGLPAGILAKALGLGGNCYTLDAACASSLYSINYAINELRIGRLDAVLCGGLSRPDSLYTQMGFSTLGALSPSGCCSPFDSKADGLVVGEGCGIVILKRLDDAIAQGDHIYAVVKGVGLSNDIHGNLMSPDSEGQLRAMRLAYQQANWQPTDIDLIECHGTGTPVGDNVEFNSLSTLWNESDKSTRKCTIGSVKSNIGHLLTAAGSASLIKVLLALKYKKLPPTANFSTPPNGVNLDNSPFSILNEAVEWSRRSAKTPRRAAVSAFGFGGINAHVLLEEWSPDEALRTPAPQQKKTILASETNPAIAIVGMDAQFGPWNTLADFSKRIFGDDSVHEPENPAYWWGLNTHSHIRGHLINNVEIPLGRFRIPPNELKDMLPQQLLMLQVAANALMDGGIKTAADKSMTDAGVFIGIGLDLNTTNFHIRWNLLNTAKQWAKQTGHPIDSQTLQDWIAQLKESAGPPLSANRTMGALGGIVASRIARAFNIGGPGFTLSSEECSSMHALEIGIRSLQQGDLNIAIVGAVDLTGDLRAVSGQNAFHKYSMTGRIKPFDKEANGSIIGEGAAAVILKRYDDALRDGDRVYALITGLGSASGGKVNDTIPTEKAYQASARLAMAEAGIAPRNISYIETHGSGHTEEDTLESIALNTLFKEQNNSIPRPIGSVKADIGHAGAAAGLASLVKASLCLFHKTLPPLRNSQSLRDEISPPLNLYAPGTPQYWLHNAADGPRRAMIGTISTTGNCAHAILEANNEPVTTHNSVTSMLDANSDYETLLSLEAEDIHGLLEKVQALKEFSTQNKDQNLNQLACRWHEANCNKKMIPLALSLIVNDKHQLSNLLNDARQIFESGKTVLNNRIFFTPEPLGATGKLAYVFPGSGNHFIGMGRDIARRWPEVLNHLEDENKYLASQFADSRFWTAEDTSHFNHIDLIFAQVWLGTLVSDVISSHGVKPNAIIGYSLGETTGLFATRTWTERDLMLQRMKKSSLFKTDLAGICTAARKTWALSENVNVDWQVGVIQCPAETILKALSNRPWVYLLIINTSGECVIGGNRIAVCNLVIDLKCPFKPIEGITTVHCEIASLVKQAYRDLHLLETTPPTDISFYSGILGRAYDVNRDSAADSITNQAIEPFDYTKVIDTAYDEGIRLFIEMGPGMSCTRMIDTILGDKPHVATSACAKGQNGPSSILRTLALLTTHRIDVDTSPLYKETSESTYPVIVPSMISVQTGHGPVKIPPLPEIDSTPPRVEIETSMIKPELAEVITHPAVAARKLTGNLPIEQLARIETIKSLTHETYLRVANGITQSLGEALSLQLSLLQSIPGSQLVSNSSTAELIEHVSPIIALDRKSCLEFAVGKISRVLGPAFTPIDEYPTRVRLPDEPLMLVDRIVSIEGDALSMGSGRVITEHDIHDGAWYLDAGRIPTCIAVEAGQADLFLSGYLGIDLETKGLAVYRLLDAEITFHNPMPGTGQTIRYDIHIDHFFRQGQTWLFRFNFEGTVNSVPLLTMKNGCAGFFTQSELDAGKGIVLTGMDPQSVSGKRRDDWIDFVPMKCESYSETQLSALRSGDLIACFGSTFSNLPLQNLDCLPGERLTLVNRVLKIDPVGGRFGLGMITGEADIHEQDWFLTCHFIDDQVMPGTLMYECCLHTLRIFLMRLGWVGEKGKVIYEPVPNVTSKLKCRGQVIETTNKVQYEISVKELGYKNDGTPYAIADALMYADDRAIVQMSNMSLQLNGLTRNNLEKLWKHKDTPTTTDTGRPAIFDSDSILAFATGKPSEAFGDRYRIFDEHRVIARLPGPPYKFLDRIVSIQDCAPWELKAGGIIEAEYDVPADAWYFAANRQRSMPFSVLLEIALQPCGWLAAYLGSALKSDKDLSFRNLGGNAIQHKQVTEDTGILITTVKITSVVESAGMIIQNFDFTVRNNDDLIYSGDTNFGFFSKQALANQVGIREAALYMPADAEQLQASSFLYPDHSPFPQKKLQMIDQVEMVSDNGGSEGLGFIQGTANVDPSAWFFEAHFYQDPVWPGSLGLESFIQLLKIFALKRWGAEDSSTEWEFESMAQNQPHTWIYRGQIIPGAHKVTVQAAITESDDAQKLLKADGFLIIDGRIIYQMRDFTLRMGER